MKDSNIISTRDVQSYNRNDNETTFISIKNVGDRSIGVGGNYKIKSTEYFVNDYYRYYYYVVKPALPGEGRVGGPIEKNGAIKKIETNKLITSDYLFARGYKCFEASTSATFIADVYSYSYVYTLNYDTNFTLTQDRNYPLTAINGVIREAISRTGELIHRGIFVFKTEVYHLKSYVGNNKSIDIYCPMPLEDVTIAFWHYTDGKIRRGE